MSKKGKIIFIVCACLIIIAISVWVSKKAYDDLNNVEDTISNLTVIDVDKMKDLFDESETKIIFVGSLDCPHCTSVKPKMNELAEKLDIKIYYLELSTITKEEEEKFYNANEFLNQGTSIPLVMAVKNGEVIDSFVGNIEQDQIETFLKTNLNIK